jgi:hypothetical protein
MHGPTPEDDSSIRLAFPDGDVRLPASYTPADLARYAGVHDAVLSRLRSLPERDAVLEERVLRNQERYAAMEMRLWCWWLDPEP